MADAVPLATARDTLDDLVASAVKDDRRTVLSKDGKPVAAVVSLADLEALEAFEDAADVAAYDEAKAEYEADGRRTVSLEEVMSGLKIE